jgi:hypothetical protein
MAVKKYTCRQFLGQLLIDGWKVEYFDGSIAYLRCPTGQTMTLDLRYDTATDYPTGDGATLEWTPSTAGAHYVLIDDNAGTSDYISVANTSGPTKIDIQTYTTFTVGSVSQIMLSIYGKLNNADGQTPTAGIYMAGGWTDQGLPFTDTAAWYYLTFTGTWTQADLNAMQSRVSRVIGTRTATIYSIKRTVTYSAAASALSANLTDTLTESESITPKLLLKSNLTDTLTESESSTPKLLLKSNLTDTLTESESIATDIYALPIAANVSDTIAGGEDVIGQLSAVPTKGFITII